MKYFNLKIGNPRVNGHIIQVNQDAHLEERVGDITGCAEFALIRYERGVAYYEADFCKNDSGEPRAVVGVSVSDDGSVKLSKVPEHTKVYFRPMTEEGARKMKQDQEYWDMMRLYVSSEGVGLKGL